MAGHVSLMPTRTSAPVLGFLEDAFVVLRCVFGGFSGKFCGAFGTEATGSEGVERPFDADLVLADLAQEIIHPRSGGHLCLARRASKGRVPETLNCTASGLRSPPFSRKESRLNE